MSEASLMNLSSVSRQPSCQDTISNCSNIKLRGSTIFSCCRICLSKFKDPAALACGHRFCERCLNSYWQFSEMPEQIVCPLCRDRVTSICFVKKEQVTSTEDFRRMFHSEEEEDNQAKNNVTILFIIKLSIVITFLYYFSNWAKPTVLQALSIVWMKIKHAMNNKVKNL